MTVPTAATSNTDFLTETPAPARRPLRILEVASGLPNWGGTEIHLLALSERLSERGHHVTVLAQPGTYVEAEAQKRGLPILNATIRKQGGIGPLRTLLRVMRSQPWDVVHVHWAPDYLIPPLAARLAKVPVVLMSHHSPHPLKPILWRQKLWRGNLLNRIIALSESVRQMLLAHQMPPQKVVTIHHGTDTDGFRHTTVAPDALRREWGIAPAEFVVGIAGRVSNEKGVDVFLRAIAALKDLPLRGVVIGDGLEMERLQGLSKELGLDDRIVWAGFRSDVNNAINALDVLVLASTWAEPCAAVVQQAMALGKPVIGTDTGGTPEMVANGATGLLVPPEDAPALTRAIATLFHLSDAERRTMGQAGEARAEALFTQRGMVDKIEQLYYDELARCAGGAK